MPPDADLLRDYAESGSQSAFAALVQGKVDLVYSVALRRLNGDAHAAEDVTQRVFLLLARKARELSRHPALSGWLFNATRLTARSVMRADHRWQKREREATTMNMENAAAGGDAETWEQMRPLIDGLLDKLGASDRQAVLWRYYESRPFADIASSLAISEDAARMRVQRALEKLRGHLERAGVRSGTAAIGALLTTHAVTAAPTGLAAQLAAVATVPAAVGPLLVFMSIAKFTAAAAAVLLAAGLALHEYRASRASEQAFAAAGAAHQELLASLSRLQRRESRSAGPAQGDGPKRVGGNALHPTEALSPRERGQAFLAAHPEVLQAMQDRSRARALARYGDFFAQHHLTPDQIRAFEDILMRNESLTIENGGRTMELALTAAPTNRAGMMAALHDLLGDETFAEFQPYNELTGMHQALQSVATSLYYTDTPLTAAQAEHIQQIYFAQAATGIRPAQLRANVISQAQTFLSPAQFSALQDVLRGHETEAQFATALRQAQAAASQPDKGGLLR